MPVITVTQLNNYMKRYIEQNVHLCDLWIKGEISNFKHHYSGHFYFTVKDENSSLKCVMFKNYASQIKFAPKDGMNVVILGKISVYEQGGIYQLYGESMIPDGVGELYAAYEQLKNKLETEGYFSSEHKLSLPKYPRKIGVISSISGAALRDILNVFKRRYPIAEICIYPAKVQGIGASNSVCDGLEYLSNNKKCDVIIIARGGGSIEDLWAFNEENLAKSIFDCKVPIISGVGHETDYTIADFVADVRAPTPSAAAEIAVPSIGEINKVILQHKSKAGLLLKSKIDMYELIMNKYKLDSLKFRLDSKIEIICQKVSFLKSEINNSVVKFYETRYKTLERNLVKLESLNPLSVLARGYSVVMNKKNQLFDVQNAKTGDILLIVSDKGQAECTLRRVIDEKSKTTDI